MIRVAQTKNGSNMSSVASYDQTPYPDLSYLHTHPDRLATIANLLGLETALVTQCRVLEFGCAAGGNLIPMAYGLRNSEFVGIDFSPVQIAAGQERLHQLGLRNCTLLCADIGSMAAEELGQFDFIVAHGVYSWVPGPVRDRLLALCKRMLAPAGVAYVSYNTLPGWHFNGLLREAMLYHSKKATTPQEQAELAREMLSFVAENAPQEQGAYGALFRNYVEFLEKDLKGGEYAYLLHDELEEVNDPVYFHQFVEHAEHHGLQYLCEAELKTVLPHTFGPQAAGKLQQMARNGIEIEQYMDFLRNRMFRQTLLVHEERKVARLFTMDAVTQCVIASRARAVGPVLQTPGQSARQYQSGDGATLTVDHAITQVAMSILRQAWPQGILFSELLDTARQTFERITGSASDQERETDAKLLASNCLRAYGYSSQLVELHQFLPVVRNDVSSRPVASQVARLEAGTRGLVTNLWHERVQLDDLKRQLLPLLDGSRTIVNLVAELGELIEADHGAQEVEKNITYQLLWLAQAGLLVPEEIA
jgi:SAM-dependent methyltransferase